MLMSWIFSLARRLFLRLRRILCLPEDNASLASAAANEIVVLDKNEAKYAANNEAAPSLFSPFPKPKARHPRAPRHRLI